MSEKIRRREALKRMGAMVGAAAALPTLTRAISLDEEQPPNIVWLIADDVGKDLGCYGNLTVKTPNLDKLSREGVLFTNTFVCSPSCSPSRACMFTGKYPHATGAEDLHVPLPEGQIILPSMLQLPGYYSANAGKLHMGQNGADQFDKVYGKVNAWTKFFDERPKDSPFFLAVGFHDAHRPYSKDTIPEPHNPAEVIVPPYMPDVPEIREELALYYDEISRMDGEIGKILERLDAEGLAENTIVGFWGDNGMPFPKAKTTLYEDGIETPMIFRWPGHAPAGGVHRGLASLIDLTPTMLEAAEIPVFGDIQGESMLNAIIDPSSPGRKHIFAERNWHNIDDHIRAVRTEQFKYIRNYYPNEPLSHPSDTVNSPSYVVMRQMRDEGTLTPEQMLIFRSTRPAEELYDIQKDPHEFQNLANKSEYQNVLRELREVLSQWVIETDDVSPGKRMVNNLDLETGERIGSGGAPQPR